MPAHRQMTERIMCVLHSLGRIDYPLIFGKHTLSELIIASLYQPPSNWILWNSELESHNFKQTETTYEYLLKNFERFPFLIRHFCYLIAVRMRDNNVVSGFVCRLNELRSKSYIYLFVACFRSLRWRWLSRSRARSWMPSRINVNKTLKRKIDEEKEKRQ